MNQKPESLRDWLPPPDLLQHRVILVTGAANGIGKAVVKDMAAHGATTVLLDRDVKGLEQTYDEIVAAGHPQPAIYPMDLQGAAAQDYTRLAATLEQEFKQLDGLVHNAAQLGALVPFANFEHELWFNTLQVNLNAPYLMTMACLGLLNASKDASIVFTSDAVGRHGKAYWGAYAVSKAGLEAFMQVLADELEMNTPIRVNSIDPGPVRTTLRRTAYPAEMSDTLNAPGDITRPFLYLAGPESRGITGQQFTLKAML
ncbi:MAG: YciK family oxidoreductase [Gammaproteobacteria bacterium]|jgi:NAD(P)-dependent dehydrogenase (short-subunit alcohol dehydrogenase family)